MHLACSLTWMDSPCNACSNQAHCTGTHTWHTRWLWNFVMETLLHFLCILICFFRSWDYCLCLSLLSPTWTAPMFICVGERQKCPHSFFSLLHHFRYSLTRNRENALLLHHNHSGMTIQCPTTLEQSGNGWKQAAEYTNLYKSPQARVCPHVETASLHKNALWSIDKINCMQLMKLLLQSNQLHFYMKNWKNNPLYKWMYKHCHLTPSRLNKGRKPWKKPHTTHTYEVVGKKNSSDSLAH